MLQTLRSWTTTTTRTYGAGAAAGAAAKGQPAAKTPAKAPTKPAAKVPTKPAAKPPVKPAPKKPQTPLGKDQLTLSPKVPTPTPKPVAPPPPPEAPVAESTAKAIEAAMKGERVRVKAPKVEQPFSLAVEPVGGGAGEGLKTTTITFGVQKVTVAIAAGQADDAALLRALNVLVQVPNDLRATIAAVHVEDVTAEGDRFSMEMKELNGRTVNVGFKRTGTEGDLAVYEMTAEGQTVTLKAAPEEDLPWEMARAAQLVTQISPKHRKVVKLIEIHNEANPMDAYWEKTYNMPGFVSAATATQSKIQFWNGNRNMYEATFHHEVGHLVGQRLSKKGDSFVPEGWEDAAKADAKVPTSYAGASMVEDFAESYSVYVTLRNGRPAYAAGTKDLAEFEEKYPNRAKLLAAFYEAEMSAPEPKGGGVAGLSQSAFSRGVACPCPTCRSK